MNFLSSPFLVLILPAFCSMVFTFARPASKGELLEEPTALRIVDGSLAVSAMLIMIFGYVFDGDGVPAGEPLKVYAQLGKPLSEYMSLAHRHGAALIVVWLLGFVSYWLLRVYHRRLSPIIYCSFNAVLILCVALAALYLVHTGFSRREFDPIDPVQILQTGCLTIGLLYLAQLKRSLDVWAAVRSGEDTENLPAWQRALHRVLDKRWMHPLPWIILLFPIQIVIQFILVLFGQRPDSFIREFLDTSGYHLSRIPAPPPEMVPGNGHYLCTVAARGHRRVVKPLRAGIRHGEAIPINRQLMIANAFENVLEQYMPSFHRVVRRLYDRYGYPVSRHIRSKAAADAVYVMMKPLEWLFLLVLYTVDARPENRIHVQYSAWGKNKWRKKKLQ